MKKNIMQVIKYAASFGALVSLAGACFSGSRGAPDTTKLNKNGIPVINEIWGEPAVDPRCVIGYHLAKSGTPLFDRFVILYGGRIANDDCAQNPAITCTKSGLHLHFDDNVWNLLKNYKTYYKPLRDKGIKVLMGLVPKDGGACISTIESWPMNDVWNWKEKTGGDYPFGPEAVDKLIQEVKEALAEYELDGVGYDEEYGNKKNAVGQGLGTVYPGSVYYKNAQDEEAAWRRGGENLFRFAYKLQQEIPGVIQDVYEILYGTHIPSSLEIDGKTVKMTDVFGISYNAYYGSWQEKSTIKMPRARFGPVAIDIGSGIQSTALPPPTKYGFKQAMEDHLAANYGVLMYYCIRERAGMRTDLPNYYGEGIWQPENYLSRISTIIYGEPVAYKGKDYPRLW